MIFDIGMHNGDDTDFYLAKGFRVLAVDANPVLCADALTRFATPVKSGRLTVLNVGIGPSPGIASFYVNEVHSVWSSFDFDIASRGHPVKSVEVEIVLMDRILDKFGVPYYAKVDIEGYDHHAVLALAKAPTKPRYVSFENGAPWLFEEIVKSGYSKFRIVNQAKIADLNGDLAGEGRAIHYEFKFGSSGPFGRDLAGEWMEADAMRESLARLQEERAALETSRGEWFDLHAAL